MKKLNIPRRSLVESRSINSRKPRRETKAKKATVNCAWCGKSIQLWPYRLNKATHFYCSKQCKASHWHEVFSGENAHNWQGGHWTELSNKRLHSLYKRAKKQALKRDEYTCQLCGSKSDIIVHHIITVKKDPTKIFDVGNLISLCDDCHRVRVNRHEEEFEQMFMDIVAKTVNCWNTLKLLPHNTVGNGECEG